MTRQIVSTSEMHASILRAQRPATWLTILVMLVIISLGCGLIPKAWEAVPQGNPVTPTNPAKPGKRLRFEKTDCSVAGITFGDITVNYVFDDNYDGSYLICNSSSQGEHGSVTTYFSVMAYKADKLDAAYNDMQGTIQGGVDQANKWNADPTLPFELKDVIDFIRNSDGRYVVVISSEANVQKCYRGYGYGIEKFRDKYLIHLSFESCELGDASLYKSLMMDLEQAAYNAIFHVEDENTPIPLINP